MTYTDVRKVLNGKLVGEEFNINGKFQIIVTLPGSGPVVVTGAGTFKVELQFRSPNTTPPAADRWIPWETIEQEGIIEGEGIQGVLYRMVSVEVSSTVPAKTGVHASVWPIRNWISSRPGR